MRKYLVEFIGTTLFMFAIFGAILFRSPLAPIGIGAALMVMVYAGGHISGGHFNPAVSLAVFVRGRLPVGDLGPYVIAQLLGACLGYLIARVVFSSQLSGINGAFNLSSMVLGALLAELVFTFALGWVVLNVATSDDHPVNSFYGLAIGFTVTAGAVAVGNVSGAAFNPAVTLGLMLSGIFAWKWIWLYLVAQLVGGALAGVAFRFVEQDDRDLEDEPEEDLTREPTEPRY